MRRKVFKRIFSCLALGFLLLLAVIARPALHILRTIRNDKNEVVAPANGRIDDASRLDEMPIAEIWKLPAGREEAEKQLADLLQRCRTSHLKISIAGARHSMGGHTISRDGVVIDMLPFNRMELDETAGILRVQSGARWHDIIAFLNARGFSVEVMQSNDDFSVGGSLSVNCHGWNFAPASVASTVESFRLMLADGKIVKCSRDENRELFSLVLGGYGLFGIILDANLHVVRNEKYEIDRITVSPADFARVFKEKTVRAADVGMIYGRLDVTPSGLLKDGTINLFRRRHGETNLLVTSLGEPKKATLKRAIFRGSAGSDYGKELRWECERWLDPRLSGSVFDRNEILYESVSLFQGRGKDNVDTLVECFVPPTEFDGFVADLRRLIPEYKVDLMNVTVRHVTEDKDAFLRYADKEMFSLVMLFNQPRSAEGEAAMSNATRAMIDAALRHGGRYYLPYRLHATAEQFAAAYPQAGEFFRLKSKYDPEELFQNEFYRHYGK